ncbi:hypothetical protein [Delftia lacustris]|uniref:hypothetical protein n=1 Tax=Delftia lacustris TaxID=558537 RepID=UPI0035A68D96
MEASVYRVKGCPHCGAKPILSAEGEGQDRTFTLDCFKHPDFSVRARHYVEHPEGPGVLRDQQWVIHSEEKAIEEIIADWNDDHGYLMLGADPKAIQSRAFFVITLSTK